MCTTSFRFCSSPSGHCTNFVCGSGITGSDMPHQTMLVIVAARRLPHPPAPPPHLRPHGVVVPGSSEGAAELGYLPGGLVYGDDVTAGVGKRLLHTLGPARQPWSPPSQLPSYWLQPSPCLDLLLGERLYHLRAQVVYRLHLGGLQGQLADLRTLEGGRRGQQIEYRAPHVDVAGV